MSKSLLKRRVFTEKEFKQADKIERIRMSQLQPSLMLNQKEYEYYGKLKSAFHVISDSLSQLESVRKISDLFPEMRAGAISKLIRNTELFYGQMLKRNKDMSRAVLIDKATKLHQLSIEKEDLKTAAEALKIIGKFEKLDQADEIENVYEDLALPDISFTNNPEALKTQDIDFEYINEEE